MRAFAFLLRRRRSVLLATALAVAALAPGLFSLRVDNGPEAFFVRDAEAVARYRAFEHTFGRDRTVRLVLGGDGLWTAEGVAWLGRLEDGAAALRGTTGALGIVGHARWRGDDAATDPQALRARALADPLDRDMGWISADGRTVTVLVGLYRLPRADRATTLDQLEALLTEAPPGITGRSAGLATIERALDMAMLDFVGRFLPWLAVLAVAALAAIVRRPLDVIAPLAVVTATGISTFGALGRLGHTLDMVSVVLAPLIFVITLATAVHVVMRFRRLRSGAAGEARAVLATCREKVRPVVWTGITSAVAFGSLASAEVPPVRALGLWSAIGIAVGTAATLALLPALLSFGKPGAGRREDGDRGFDRRVAGASGRLALWAVRNRRAVALAAAATGALAMMGATRLEVGTGLLGYLRADHPARAAIDDLERAGLTAAAAELIVTLPDARAPRFDTPAGLARLEAAAQALRIEAGFAGVVSFAEVVDGLANRLSDARHDRAAERGATLERLRADATLDRLRAALVSADGRTARIVLQLEMAGYERLGRRLDRAEEIAREALPGAEAWVTGQYPLVLAAQRSLLVTMARSLGLSLLAVTAAFAVLLRSVRGTALALVPNLWPVLAVLAVMGFLGLPVDSSTVMVAAVALGVAVDDTLHTLSDFRRGLRSGARPERAAVAALERTAPAHLLTSGILAAGFGVCALSSFVPIARFGALTACAVLAALAADLVLVPALLATLGEPARDRSRR